MQRRGFASAVGLAGVGVGAAASLIAKPAIAQPVTESTFDRVRNTKKLRVAGIVGTEPYYHRDIVTKQWSGFCMSMARDLAQSMGAEIEVSETTWGNAVLDLEAKKIDIMFGLSPTPSRALVIEFTNPIMENTFTIIAKPGFKAETWDQLNKPEIRIAVDIGSTHYLFARHFLPKATLIALATPVDAVMALQSGRADLVIQVAMLSLVTIKKNPSLGKITVPTPLMHQPTCAGVRVEDNQRFRIFVNAWLEYNHSYGMITDWITSSLALVGIQRQDIPPDIQF